MRNSLEANILCFRFFLVSFFGIPNADFDRTGTVHVVLNDEMLPFLFFLLSVMIATVMISVIQYFSFISLAKPFGNMVHYKMFDAFRALTLNKEFMDFS